MITFNLSQESLKLMWFNEYVAIAQGLMVKVKFKPQ